MASLASHQRPNLTVDVGLAQTSGRNPRQSSRAQTHAARSAQAPRTQHYSREQQPHPHQAYQRTLDQGGFSSDEDVQQPTSHDQGVTGQYDDPVDSSEEDERTAAQQLHQSHYQHHQQQRNDYQDGINDRYYGDDSDSINRRLGAGSMVEGQEEDGEETDEGDVEEEEEEEEEEEDDDDELSSSPSIPDENIDFDLVYALHSFPATVEGQATVDKGNSLTLLDDSNSYWWLVRVLHTQEVGYIPAENIETPFERLARLNKHRNVDLTAATDDDVIQVPSRIFSSHLVKQRDASGEVGMSEESGKLSALSRRRDGAPNASPSPQPYEKPSVVFGPPSYVEHSGDEYGSEEGEEYEEDGDFEEGDEEEEDEEEEDLDEDEIRAQLEQEHGYDGADSAGPDIRTRGAEVPAGGHPIQSTASVIPTTAEGKKAMLDKMEPYDGMDWDAQEREGNRSEKERKPSLQQQQKPASEQVQSAGAGAPGSSYIDGPLQDQAQLGYGQPPRQQQSATAPGSTPGILPRTTSNRSILSNASNVDPSLASQGQAGRDRATSTGSEHSQISSTTSQASVKDKERKRKSKSASIDAGEEGVFTDEKSTKKRSGVFSGLFSRNKDKKERKSGSFSSTGGSTIPGNEESIVVTRPSEESARPREASPGLTNQPLGPTGLGRALQERDRASQDAYSRQFLGDRSGSFNDSLSPRQSKQRPGSLIGTPSTVPMLNVVRVFAGEGVHSDSTFKTVLLNESTSARDLVRQATQRFRLQEAGPGVEYYLTVKLLEGNERALRADEKPLQVYDRLCQLTPDEATVMPSVKRSSIGSISSISSNLSLNPAIARVNGDFSDDHSVKFFLARVVPGGQDSNNSDHFNISVSSSYGGSSNRSSQTIDANHPGAATPASSSTMRSRTLDVPSADSSLLQAPTARFALRLLIFPSDLPEGTVFDPQTTALVPASVLHERGPGGSVPSEHVEQRFREKILSLASNATVAEVIESGLDRFGIVEGVVEGGDHVEDRARRKSRTRIQYGLTVDVSRGGPPHERPLAPNSKIVDAYPVSPIFKTSTANKRRSTDSVMLLNMAEEQIRVDDPLFILRAVGAHSHAHGKHGKTVRALSPTEGRLISKQEQQRQADLVNYKTTAPSSLTGAVSNGTLKDGSNTAVPHAGASTPTVTPRSRQQEVIAAQRAAAKERKAIILGAQRNDVQGVDLYIQDQGKIRSSRSLEGKVRYSFMPDTAHSSEVDISAIVEDVLADQDPARFDPHGRDGGGSRPSGPARDASSVTVNTFHSPPSTPTGLGAPMDPRDAHIDWRSQSQSGSTAPLSLGSAKGTNSSGLAQQKDLLETLVRDPKSEESLIEDRIDSVLTRVAQGSRSINPNEIPQDGQGPPITGATSEIGGGSSVGGRTTADTYKSGIGSEHSHDGTMTTNPTPVSTVGTGGVGIAARGLPGGALVASNPANLAQAENPATQSGPASSLGTAASSYSGPAAYIPSGDFGLDHLYTIVDAAMRRAPHKYTQVPVRSRSTTPGSKRISGIGIASPTMNTSHTLGSPHQFAAPTMLQLAPLREPLKPQTAGLFFVPPTSSLNGGGGFIEDQAVMDHYAPLNRQLNQMEDSLDQLLADVMKVF